VTRYIPTARTAAGGISSVVFCHDTNLDRIVALKSLQPGREHRRLLDELAALQRIRSKHVVEIFDVAYLSGGTRMAVVQEAIDGDDLTSRLGSVSADEVFVRLIYQVASGVADIHAVDLIHRDIKPSNVLVDREGILKIIDFNLARLSTDAHTRGFVGTRGYAAPELYANGPVHFDAKIDVYSLGVLAWALLHGPDLPSPLSEVPPRPDVWKADGGFTGLGGLDATLRELLNGCVSGDPTDRPAAAEVSNRAGRVLLRGKHRALFTDENGRRFELDASKPRITVEHASLGSLVVEYDGLDVRVAVMSGEVWINNMRLAQGEVLPNSCVIALGGPSRPANSRIFITMDVSHPEVVL